MKGFFIVFEGIEGCGKSTQAKLLYQQLAKEGVQSLLTKEPGGTALGNKLRALLKRGDSISPEAELLLFNASRAQLVKEAILPALGEGKIVISDRFYPSTLAYQGYGRGVKTHVIEDLNEFATKGLKPDIIVLLDMESKKGLSRKPLSRRDRFEEEAADFHTRVRKGYLEMVKQEPARWFVLDANQGKKKIASLIYEEVKRRLESKRRSEHHQDGPAYK